MTTYNFSIILLIAISYTIWLVWRSRKRGTNIILRCAACGKIGTMKKTSSPQDNSYHTDDLLDNNSSPSHQKYTYTCISCQAEVEL